MQKLPIHVGATEKYSPRNKQQPSFQKIFEQQQQQQYRISGSHQQKIYTLCHHPLIHTLSPSLSAAFPLLLLD